MSRAQRVPRHPRGFGVGATLVGAHGLLDALLQTLPLLEEAAVHLAVAALRPSGARLPERKRSVSSDENSFVPSNTTTQVSSQSATYACVVAPLHVCTSGDPRDALVPARPRRHGALAIGGTCQLGVLDRPCLHRIGNTFTANERWQCGKSTPRLRFLARKKTCDGELILHKENVNNVGHDVPCRHGTSFELWSLVLHRSGVVFVFF